MAPISGTFAQALCSVVGRCLNKDADARPSASELLRDPLFRHAHDSRWLARRLLQPPSPAERAGKKVSFRENAPPNDSPTSSLVPPPVRQPPNATSSTCAPVLSPNWVPSKHAKMPIFSPRYGQGNENPVIWGGSVCLYSLNCMVLDHAVAQTMLLNILVLLEQICKVLGQDVAHVQPRFKFDCAVEADPQPMTLLPVSAHLLF
jgi:serine/threonine protein kinase